ncbi:MAG: amino acid ABC transporter permease [Mesorhizobium sp.]|uniref:amino acid ABC transporter permease n=1 Tax=Mesorhizobium sp. TaxID=1871066 RepID=UPI001AD33FC3|nr:amino acid ABC transporter permease [Mesorhizobium sp.]MBN9217262.1 amino acid ABC transporter permease [Mesorhizobium sp.]
MSFQVPYVRDQEAPRLPPPEGMVGIAHWLREGYFRSVGSGLVTLVLGALAVWIAWRVIDFAVLRAVWTGGSRDACLPAAGTAAGACWPFVADRFGQWLYGFYPIGERWRVNLCFLAGLMLIVPMLTPSFPWKMQNALLLLVVFPLFTLVMLTGGNFHLSIADYATTIGFLLFLTCLVPVWLLGLAQGLLRNKIGAWLAGVAFVLWLAWIFAGPEPVAIGGMAVPLLPVSILALLAVSAFLAVRLAIKGAGRPGIVVAANWGAVCLAALAILVFLDADFGLVTVETAQWGGLTLTLVVSVTGIIASLPLGILLALGRRSTMPVIRIVSICFIEVVRGLPLISVLFMASVMLPLFLPPGVNFDKLLRALIGVALFSSAYMAEVVRGGLQAIPKGQYEGAMSLGLSHWQTMIKIILPQALKIAIPNIVGNFISLFKDTTLVLVVGLFDLLGMAQTGLRDASWATPTTAPTGYLVLALIYWAFCFSMSRYATFTERRLNSARAR